MGEETASMTSPAVPALTDADVVRLLSVVGAEHAALLADLLSEIMRGSGYGVVSIVVAGRHIETLKLTQSYRARDVIITEEE
jgi:hypothetical protein